MNDQERKAWLAEHGCTLTDGVVLNAQGRAICGAKTRGGRPCQKSPLTGRNRCRLHGGASPAGVASPTFKHGRRSKYMPARLVSRYEEALADPFLLEQKAEIALLDARLSELLEQVGDGSSAERWKVLQVALGDLEWAVQTQDTDGFNSAIKHMRAIIQSGSAVQDVWTEIYDVIERRRRLVESERKRYVEMGQMITAAQLLNMMGAISGLIREHVTDPAQLRAISSGLAVLASGATVGAGVALPGRSAPDGR